MVSDSPTSRPRLNALGIANFKAFGPKQQNIPLRPITLVFGPNSGGKSSLIHFLLWMKDVVARKHQTVQNRLDVHFPTASGETVDLGGFNQILHGNDTTTQIKSQVSLIITDAKRQSRQVDILSVFAVSLPLYADRLRTLVKDLYDEEDTYRGTSGTWESEYFTDDLNAESLTDNLNSLYGVMLYAYPILHKALTGLLAPEFEKIKLEIYLDDCFYGYEEHMRSLKDLMAGASPILHKIEESIEGWDPQSYVSSDVLGKNLVPFSIRKEDFIAELQNLACAVLEELSHQQTIPIKGRPSLVYFEINEGAGKTCLAAALNEQYQLVITSLDFHWLCEFSEDSVRDNETLFRPLLLRNTFQEHLDELVFRITDSWLPSQLEVKKGSPLEPFEESLYGGKPRAKECAASWEALKCIIEGANGVQGLLGRCEDAGRLHFGRIAYLAPIRAVPPRKIIVADLPMDSDALGLNAWRKLFQNEKLRTKVNRWLQHDKLSRHYQIESNHRDDASTITLRDLQSDKEVSCRDIGIGVSQVIPVLVQAMGSRDKIIAIEQPELHLHPALQAELGDVFIESAMKRGNRFVLETHSEHLILRILRRIRETTAGELPEGCTPLRPEDVAVLFIEPSENGSQVIELPVTPDGDFTRPWPGGFFAERGKELF